MTRSTRLSLVLAAFWFTSVRDGIWSTQSNVFQKWTHLKEATVWAWADKWFYFLKWHLSCILHLFCIDLKYIYICIYLWYFDLVAFVSVDHCIPYPPQGCFLHQNSSMHWRFHVLAMARRGSGAGGGDKNAGTVGSWNPMCDSDLGIHAWI